MKRILWLDAEPMGCEGLQLLLEREGHKVDLTQELESAVSQYKVGTYNLVIAEPYRDCITEDEARISQLKSFLETANRDSQVMLFTTIDLEFIHSYGMRKGEHYQHYLQKPESPTNMKPIVERILAGN